jgi:pimeloyl-ACP methyl ester carboxylesterase
MAVTQAISRELELDRPVYMGCSIGGLLALDLARYHPDEFRAVIGLEPSLWVGGTVDALAPFWHPRVTSAHKATMMYGLTAPMSPEPLRRETMSVYSQAWPPAFIGDLVFYMEDHDLTSEAAGIDTSRCPVHLLSGEYGYSATPEMGQAAHEAVPGSTWSLMPGIGHFPMAKNLSAFADHLLPVLERIKADGGVD